MAKQIRTKIYIDGLEKATAGTITLNETLNALIESMNKTEKKSETVESRLKKMKEQMAQMIAEGVDPSSDAFKNLQKNAGALERSINEAGETIKIFASRTQSLDQMVAMGNSIKTSFDSAQVVFSLFGESSKFVSVAVTKLENGMQALTGVQSVYNQMTKKGTFENKIYSAALSGMAKAQTYVAAATSISSKAFRLFRVALASTGIGLLIVALGTLVANFDKIKDAVKKAVPELEHLGKGFDKLQDVVRGFGNVVLQYVLTPLRTVSSVIRKLIEGDFKGALEVGKQEIVKGLNFIENFQDGYNQRSVDKAMDAMKKVLEMHNGLMEQIKENEANAENNSGGYAGTGNAYKERLKEYRDAFENFQSETYRIQKENDQKSIDSAKETAEEMTALTREQLDQRNAAIEEAYKRQLELDKQLHEDEISTVEAQYQILLESARKAGQETIALETAKEERLRQLRNSADMAQLDLVNEKNRKIKESNNRFDEETANDRQKALDKEFSILEKHYEDVEKAREDMVVRHRDGDGFIDIAKTRENYRMAGESLEAYLSEIDASRQRMKEYYDNLLEMYKDDAEKFAQIQNEKTEALAKFEKKETEVHKAVKANAKEAEKVVPDSLKEIVDEVSKYTESVMSAVNSVFDLIGMEMEYRLEEAQEKYDVISEKHDEMVDKVAESNDRIKSLQDEAKNAQGGRLAVIQEQIAREIDTRNELANEEKRLAKEKEKAEADLEKAERQKKKSELKMQLIQSVANTAFGIAKAVAASPLTFGLPWSAFVALTGGIQIATINKQLSKLEDGGLLNGKRHSQGGMRIEGSNIEVEGGEYVINRLSTRRNLGLVSYINSQRRELTPQDIDGYFASSGMHGRMPAFKTMFAEGGELPSGDSLDTYGDNAVLRAIESINLQPVVSVVDIANVQQNMAQVTDWTNTR